MRKVLILMVILGLIGSFIFASQQEVRILIESWMMQKFPVATVVNAFEETHPGVKVVVTQISDVNTVYGPLMLQWERGTTPYDLVLPMDLSTDYLPFAKRGLIVNLDNMFDNPDFRTAEGSMLHRRDFIQGFLKPGIYDGKIYQMPVFGEVSGLGYRKDLLQEYDLPVPTTWQEIEEDAKVITAKSGGKVWGIATPWQTGTIIYEFFAWVMSRGGTLLDKEGNLNFDSPIAIQTLQWFADARNKWHVLEPDIAENYENARSNMLAGRVGLYPIWISWCIQAQQVLGTDKVGWTLLPDAAERGTTIYSGSAIIPKCGNVKLAEEFLAEELESKYFQQWSFLHYGKSPVILQYYEGLPGNTKEIMDAISKGEDLPAYTSISQMTNTAIPYMTEALTGTMSATQACHLIYQSISTMPR